MTVCALMVPVMASQSNGCCLWFMNKVCCCFKQNNNNRFAIPTYDSDEESSESVSLAYPQTVMTSTDEYDQSSYNETNDVFCFNQLDPYETDFRNRGLTLKFQTEAAQYKASRQAAEEKINSGLSQAQDVLKQQQEYVKTLDQARNAYRDAEAQVEARRREHEEGSADDLGATPKSGRHSTIDLKQKWREAEDQYTHAMRQSLSIGEQLGQTVQSLNDSYRQREQASSELATLKKEKKAYEKQKAEKEEKEIAQEIEKMIQSSKERENEYYNNETICSPQNERSILSFIDDDKLLF